MREPGDRPFARLSDSLGLAAADRWWNLSEQLRRVTPGTDVSEVLPALDEAASADPQAPVAPAFRLWAADALSRAARDTEAVRAYDDAISLAEVASTFEGIDLISEALRHKAGALARLGDMDAAVTTLRELGRRGMESALFRAGVVAERAGRFDQAVEYYQENADSARNPDTGDPGQQALRAAERLVSQQGRFTPAVIGEIPDVLDLVGLGERAADRFGQYSFGMKQRLGLAAALLGDPELLVLDDRPTASTPPGSTTCASSSAGSLTVSGRSWCRPTSSVSSSRCATG